MEVHIPEAGNHVLPSGVNDVRAQRDSDFADRAERVNPIPNDTQQTSFKSAATGASFHNDPPSFTSARVIGIDSRHRELPHAESLKLLARGRG